MSMNLKLNDYLNNKVNEKKIEKHKCLKSCVLKLMKIFEIDGIMDTDTEFSKTEINLNKLEIIDVFDTIYLNYATAKGYIKNKALNIQKSQELFKFFSEEREIEGPFTTIRRVINFIKTLFRYYLHLEFKIRKSKNISFYSLKPFKYIEIYNNLTISSIETYQDGKIISYLNAINRNQCQCMNRKIEYGEIVRRNGEEKTICNIFDTVKESNACKELDEIDTEILLIFTLSFPYQHCKFDNFFKCEHGKVGICLNNFKYSRIRERIIEPKLDILEKIFVFTRDLEIDEGCFELIIYQSESKIYKILQNLKNIRNEIDFYDGDSHEIIGNIFLSVEQLLRLFENYLLI